MHIQISSSFTWLGHGNVSKDAIVEQSGFLGDQSYLRSPPIQLQGFQIMAVDKYLQNKQNIKTHA